MDFPDLDSVYGKIAATSAVLVLLFALVFVGSNFFQGSIFGDSYVSLGDCDSSPVIKDGQYKFSCRDASQSGVGSTVVFNTYDTVNYLETYDPSSNDIYEQAAKHLIVKETNFTEDQIGTRTSCKSGVDEPVICVSENHDDLEDFITQYGEIDYVFDGALGELYTDKWQRAYRFTPSLMEGIVDSYKDYGSCTADVIWDNWDADQGNRNQEIVVNGTIGYYTGASDGIGCKVENPDPDKFGHLEDVNDVSWTIDLNRVDYVSGYVKSTGGEGCVREKFEESSTPEQLFDSEQACVDHYSIEAGAVSGPEETVINNAESYSVEVSSQQGVDISWSNGDTGQSATYSWDTTGSKTVSVTVDDGFSEKTRSMTVDVKSAPKPPNPLDQLTSFFNDIWSILTFSG